MREEAILEISSQVYGQVPWQLVMKEQLKMATVDVT